MSWAIIIALLAAMSSGFFAACSIALREVSRSRLADLLEQRNKNDQVSRFFKNAPQLSLMTGTARSGLTLVVLLATLFHVEENWGRPEQWSTLTMYLVALSIASIFVVVFGVAIPVSVARYHPERMLARSMPLLNGCLFVFSPFIRVLYLFDPFIRRLTGAEEDSENGASDEVMSVVQDHHDEGAVDEEQKEMIEAVFEFKSTTAGEIMTPRTDMEGIDVTADLQMVRETIIEIGHSRIPVYQEDYDHIVGILYAKDLIKLLGVASESPFDLRSLLREPMLVPETKTLDQLLHEFKASKVHLAIVLDEYGGTAGLVTIEDILEEIVGEIEDEYEPEEERPSIRIIEDGIAEVDARVYVDQLNDELELDLPEDEDYDTVGGFVFSELGHIPEPGETFEFGNLRVTVLIVERTHVNRVKIDYVANGKQQDTAPSRH